MGLHILIPDPVKPVMEKFVVLLPYEVVCVNPSPKAMKWYMKRLLDIGRQEFEHWSQRSLASYVITITSSTMEMPFLH